MNMQNLSNAAHIAYEYLSSRYSEKFARSLKDERQLIAVYSRVYNKDMDSLRNLAAQQRQHEDCTAADIIDWHSAINEFNEAATNIRSIAAHLIISCANAAPAYIKAVCTVLNDLVSQTCKLVYHNKKVATLNYFTVYSFAALPTSETATVVLGTCDLIANWFGYGIAYYDGKFTEYTEAACYEYCSTHCTISLKFKDKTVPSDTLMKYVDAKGIKI